MSKNKFLSVKTDGKWWKGEINIRYNLKETLAWILTALTFIFAVIFWYVLQPLWRWACNLWSKWRNRPRKPKPETIASEPGGKKRKLRLWHWLLLLILLLCGVFYLWKSLYNERQRKQTPSVVYDASFDQVIIARAYLDGVQSGESKHNRVLVGLKIVNDQKVGKDFSFEGMTYEQARDIIAQDWKPLVIDNLSPNVKLTEQQMSVVILTAMRMGKYGFPRSAFLQMVNAGDFKEASHWLRLENANHMGVEPTQYFYMLRLLWENKIAIKDLLDLPIHSYRGEWLTVDKMYDDNGNTLFNNEILRQLKTGWKKTPREALEL